MNILFRLLLTLSALSLFFSLFLINNEIILVPRLSNLVNYMIYTLMPFGFSTCGVALSKKLGTANLGKVEFVESSNNDFLSNYLAFFFVALSLEDWITFGFCFILTFIFTFLSRVSYFNPILLIFGYNFYYIHLRNKSKVMLIAKQKIKDPSDIEESKQFNRINDYTFMGN